MFHSNLQSLSTQVERGALSELSGPRGEGKTLAALHYLAGSPGRIAWIERALTIYPCALAQRDVALERVLFVEAGAPEGLLWAAQQVLASQVFGSVVLDLGAPLEDAVCLRRLQLAAEKSQAAVLLLSERATRESWPLRFQARVEGHEIRILKSRQGRAQRGTEWLQRSPA
ncbi:MAG: hypothetical protein NDJ89_01105 [Oligoflexia bacterium]|nr:hypothetical protein [Oligoflexia bacterium]